MSVDERLDMQFVLDGLGQGILIFDKDGKLIFENQAARTLLGTDINVLRTDGWKAAAVLFNAGLRPGETVESARDKTLESMKPVRFHIYRSGEYLPCWAAAVQGKNGEVNTMITIEVPDWEMVNDAINQFRGEIRGTLDDTLGHISLINKTIQNHKPDAKASELAKRVSNFTHLISIHMSRSRRLMDMFERLQNIRTAKVRELVKDDRKKIVLEDFLEDFLEELDEIELLDPETEARDHRSRITTQVPDGTAIWASSTYLTQILHDMLRNAIMYSLRGTPIKINAQLKNDKVQIDMIDEGYGMREKEQDRVFSPFQRARQPQIISEFGYGLSLFLCKHEVEAMNGRMWFIGEEGVGSTFSMLLPTWREPGDTAETKAVSASESSDTTT